MKSSWIGRAAFAAALLAAWAPLAGPHSLSGAGAILDWIRGEAIHAAVEAGDLLPAWLPDLYQRHGTPLPLFYSPLSYGVVEVLRQLTTSPVAAWKLAYLLFWIAGAGGAALLGRAAFGPGAGTATAAAFSLAPYLLVDAYVRVGIAEFAAFNLAPWALAALFVRGRLALAGGALAIAALVLTHNVTALAVVPALAVLALVAPATEWRRGALVVATGLALSAFFWLPALVERRELWAAESLTTGFFEFERHFLSPLDLLPGRVALAFTVGPHERLPFRFGELLWAGLVVALVATRGRPSAQRRRALGLASVALAALLATTSWAAPLWRAMPLSSFVQFPFRFFLLATLAAAPLVGLGAASVAERWRPLATGLIAAAALLLARPYLEVRYLFVERDSGAIRPVAAASVSNAASEPGLEEPDEYVTLERLRRSPWSGSAGHEYLPRTVSDVASSMAEAVHAAEPLGPGIRVVGAGWGYPEVRAEIDVERAGDLALHQFYFPGWSAEVDGVERAVRSEAGRGRILIEVRPGDRRVVARFGPTPLRRAAAAASAVAAVGLALALLASGATRPARP